MTALLCAIFFLSGAAALLFETLWFHQTGLALGNGVWATSLVLAGFMAGLALGNALVAQLGARIRRPVRFYAWMEIAIAIAGIAIVFGLPLLTPVLGPLLRPILEVDWLVNPIRLGIAFLILLIPSTAMGATLPLLVKALLARDANYGSVLGRLYGWNTLGAVVGAVAGEAALIEWFGIRGSAIAAGVLNLAVAGVAFALSKGFESEGADPRPSHAQWGGPIPPAAARRLAATFVAGATLLALEVIWFRFLQLFFHASSLVFSLMLAIVLCGIALGSFFAGAVLRRRPAADGSVAIVALLSAACVAFSYRAFSWLSFPEKYTVDGTVVLAYGAFLMGPVALLSGALFTLVGAGLDRLLSPATRATGLLTFANTVGSGLGSLIGGFVLLPLLGMEASFLVLALCYLVVAALVFPAAAPARRWAAAMGTLALVALLSFPLGLMRDYYVTIPVDRFATGYDIQVVREGRSETIIYTTSHMLGEPLSHRMVTNGFSMSGSSVLVRRYMKLYVWLPEVLHPELEKALLISYGVGSTAKALTDTDSLEQIDVVDLSREVIELSSVVYPDPKEHPLQDPRVRVHIEDGRYYLQTTDQRYDLITGEPPPPKNAGIVNLYTKEFFELVHDRLEPGGIHTYWLPIHNLTEQDTKAIVRGFCDVFADCTLWAGTGLDWMLVGSRDAEWPPDMARFRRLFADPDSVSELFATGIDAPETLGAMFMRDAEDLAALTADTLPLVDDFPKRLSEEAPDPLVERAAYASWTDPDTNREHFRTSAWVAANWPAPLVRSTGPYFDLQGIWLRHTLFSRRDLGGRVRDLHTALEHGGARSLALMELGTNADQLELLHALPAQKQRDPEALFRFGAEAMANGDWERAVTLLRRANNRMPKNERLVRIRIYALCRAGRLDEAASVARRYFARTTPDDRGYWEWLEEQFGLPYPGGPLAARSEAPDRIDLGR